MIPALYDSKDKISSIFKLLCILTKRTHSVNLFSWKQTLHISVCKRISHSSVAECVLLSAFLKPAPLSVCSVSLLSALSLGTVWLVGPVIEQLLFDEGSHRNCTRLTLHCRCLCAHVHKQGACHCVFNVWLFALCVCVIAVYITIRQSAPLFEV